MKIRPPLAGDRQDWDRLYRGYADFYRVAQTDAMRDRAGAGCTTRRIRPRGWWPRMRAAG